MTGENLSYNDDNNTDKRYNRKRQIIVKYSS